ncbi:MAG: desaturase, partial [Rhodobacteraceae bacterium]|nr:desaturase [Paracoccaceae bacterium]
HTLALMRQLGLDTERLLWRMPLNLRNAQGIGLELPDLPAPWNLLWGITASNALDWRDKLSLLRAAAGWQRARFICPPRMSVAQLCAGLRPRVINHLIEPLCVSALNTLPFKASGQVFLRVLHDALMGETGKSTPSTFATSDVLLPLRDLSRLMPEPAARWLERRGATVLRQHRVTRVAWNAGRWDLEDADGERQTFDAVIWATAPENALQTIRHSAEGAPPNVAAHFARWCAATEKLRYESIATVYTYSNEATLPRPLLRLNNAPGAPAQFVVDRGVMGDPGLWAFVISAARGEKTMLEFQVLNQARTELADHLGPDGIAVVQTVIEKRATFACTAGLKRPGPRIAPGLLACGDYTYAPYPATLEGAVRS